MLHPSQMFYGNLSKVDKMVNSVKRSRIGLKSDRWRVVIFIGQTTEYHLVFVREDFRIFDKIPV